MDSKRRPGAVEAWTLISAGWLSTVAATLLSPLLPDIGKHFRDSPNLAVKISLVATGPALFVALLAPLAGHVADRLGYKAMLLRAVMVYGVVGIAPLFLQSLDLIILSRAAVGIAEAAIMTSANALIATYFFGAERQKWFAMEAGTAPIVSTLMIALGGALGQSGWRTPFAVYGSAFLLLPLIWLLPKVTVGPRENPDEEPFSAARLALICAITLGGASAFFVAVVQFGFLFEARGPASPQTIGMWLAVSSIGNPIGAVVFGLMAITLVRKVALSLAIMGLGFLLMIGMGGHGGIVTGAFVVNFAAGIFLPSMVSWALSSLPPGRRGVGVGAWTSAFFLGQFVSPLSILALRRLSGSLDGAVTCYSLATLAGAVVLAGWRPTTIAPYPA